MTPDRHVYPGDNPSEHEEREDCPCEPEIETIVQYPGVPLFRFVTHAIPGGTDEPDQVR